MATSAAPKRASVSALRRPLPRRRAASRSVPSSTPAKAASSTSTSATPLSRRCARCSACCRRSSSSRRLGSAVSGSWWSLGCGGGVDTLDLHPAIVERGAAAEIGSALRSKVVGVAPVGRIFLPPQRGRHYHAGAWLAVDAHAQRVGAALGEHAHAVALEDAAHLGVVGVHVEVRLALELAKARQVGEARVEGVARRRREEGERIALGERRLAPFHRRGLERQPGEAPPFPPRAFGNALSPPRPANAPAA